MQEHGDVLSPPALAIGVGQILFPGNLALAQRGLALRVNVGTKKGFVATTRTGVDQGAVVGVDGEFAQFGCGGRAGEGNALHGGQGVAAQTRREQVIALAVIAFFDGDAHEPTRSLECGAIAPAGASAEQGSDPQEVGEYAWGHGRSFWRSRDNYELLGIPLRFKIRQMDILESIFWLVSALLSARLSARLTPRDRDRPASPLGPFERPTEMPDPPHPNPQGLGFTCTRTRGHTASCLTPCGVISPGLRVDAYGSHPVAQWLGEFGI